MDKIHKLNQKYDKLSQSKSVDAKPVNTKSNVQEMTSTPPLTRSIQYV